MSYNERPDGYKGVKYGLSGAGIFGLILLVRMLASIGAAATGSSPAMPVTSEARLLADPHGGQLFSTIKRAYPEEFDRLVAVVDRQKAMGADEKGTSEAVLDDLIEAGRRHRREMIQAPHAALANYRETEIILVEAMQAASPLLCATYVTTGAVRADTAAVPPDLFIAFRQASWEADAAGRDQPVGRTVTAPSPAIIAALRRNMLAAGLTADEIRAYFDDGTFKTLPDVRKCRIGLAVARALDRLPDAQADGMLAYIISRAP